MVVGFLCHKVVLNLLRDNHLTADTRPFFPMIYDFSFELNERDLDNKMNVDTLMKKGWVNYLKPLEITKSHQEFKIQIELPNFTNLSIKLFDLVINMIFILSKTCVSI